MTETQIVNFLKSTWLNLLAIVIFLVVALVSVAKVIIGGFDDVDYYAGQLFGIAYTIIIVMNVNIVFSRLEKGDE